RCGTRRARAGRASPRSRPCSWDNRASRTPAWAGASASLQTPLLEPALVHEHVPRLAALEGTHDAEALELIHDPPGARVADVEPALEQRGRTLLVTHDQSRRLVDQLVVEVRVAFLAVVLLLDDRRVGGERRRHARRGLRLPELDDARGLLLGDE